MGMLCRWNVLVEKASNGVGIRSLHCSQDLQLCTILATLHGFYNQPFCKGKKMLLPQMSQLFSLPCYESRKLKIVAHNVESGWRLEILEMCLGWILSSYHGINIVIFWSTPTWGYCVPVLPKTGDEIKSHNEKIIHSEKRGDQICFLTQIGPHRSFTPSFGFALPALSLLPIFFINSSPVRTKSCNSCELIPSFIEWDPGLITTLCLHSNWESNRDCMVKLGPPRQGDF